MSMELLEEIRLLSNLETAKSKLLQIVLVGQTELDKTLSQPELRQLRQRINLRFHLPPLSAKETREYIEKKLTVAGAQTPIFNETAIREIYSQSGGIPRLINILCDNALLNGYALDQKRVGASSIREAAKDLGLRRDYRKILIWALICLSIAVGMSLLIYLIKSGYLEPVFQGVSKGFHHIKSILSEGAAPFD